MSPTILRGNHFTVPIPFGQSQYNLIRQKKRCNCRFSVRIHTIVRAATEKT